MRIYKNPFKEGADKLCKESSTQHTTEQAVQLFRHRSHAERHRATNQAAILLSYVCNLLSGLTTGIAGTFLIYKLLLPISHYFALIASIIIALVVVGIIETIKRHSLKECLIDAIQYKNFNFGLWAVVLLFCSISIAASYKGAEMLPELTATTPKLIDTDSINQSYASQITKLEDKQTELFKIKYRGTTTRTAQQSIKEIEEQIKVLRSQSSNDIAEAKTENQNRLAIAQDEIDLDSRLFVVVALSIELLFIVCYLFSMFFYWRCFAESLPDGSSEQPEKKVSHIENISIEGRIPPHVAPRARIGFETNETKIVKDSKLRTCKECGKEYIYNHIKQKFCSDSCRMKFHNKKRIKSN